MRDVYPASNVPGSVAIKGRLLIHTAPSTAGLVDLLYVEPLDKKNYLLRVTITNNQDTALAATPFSAPGVIALGPSQSAYLELADPSEYVAPMGFWVERGTWQGLENAQATLNGTLYGEVAPGGTLAIPIVDDEGAPKGTTNPGVNHVIADSEISVNGDLLASLQPEVDLDITLRYETQGPVPVTIVNGDVVVEDLDDCEPALIAVNGQPFASVPSGGVRDISVVDLDNNAVPGNVVPSPTRYQVPDDLRLICEATQSPTTFVIKLRGAADVVATQVLTDGSIDPGGVVINAAPGVNTFVGATLADGDTVEVTFTPTGANPFIIDLSF